MERNAMTDSTERFRRCITPFRLLFGQAIAIPVAVGFPGMPFRPSDNQLVKETAFLSNDIDEPSERSVRHRLFLPSFRDSFSFGQHIQSANKFFF